MKKPMPQIYIFYIKREYPFIFPKKRKIRGNKKLVEI